MTLETILPIPNLFEAKRILCVQPHYDDNDIAAAGTLAALHEAGAELMYATVTDDLMGVEDDSLSPPEADAQLKRDQYAAGAIVGVAQQFWLGYPDAGAYDYFAVRRDVMKLIRRLKPDFIFTNDPWLTYEAHHDHIQTGLAVAEAAILYSLSKIPSSDPAVDAAYVAHTLQGVAFYHSREPNVIFNVTATWDKKMRAVSEYHAQFAEADLARLKNVMEMKARQVAVGQAFALGEPLKVLHPSALHCGL
jgi:LmbE family N-acetylglucosaminyl deacetylase